MAASTESARNAPVPAAPRQPLPRWMHRLSSRVHTGLYRTSGGRVGAAVGRNRRPVALLTTTGRRSGQPRTTPVLYVSEGDGFVVAASNLGRDAHPAWLHNLRAEPRASVQVRGRSVPVRARIATGAERERQWQRLLAIQPRFTTFQERTDREIPVLVLEPDGPPTPAGRRTAGPATTPTRTVPRWVPWVALSAVAATWHMLIDVHLGLFGPAGATLSTLQGLWGLLVTVLTVWWLVAALLAVAGSGAALRCVLVLTLVRGLLLGGVVAIAAAPPPSDAFPFQDLAHLLGLGAGLVATRLLWDDVARRGWPRGGPMLWATVGLLVAVNAAAMPLNMAFLGA